MSKENVELVQRAFAAYFRGDESTWRELIDPEIRVSNRPDQPDVNEHRGVDGLVEFLGEWPDTWEEYSLEILHVREIGDLVATTARQRGQGKRSGVPIDDEVTFLFSVRHGKIVRLQMFGDEQEALGAAELEA